MIAGSPSHLLRKHVTDCAADVWVLDSRVVSFGFVREALSFASPKSRIVRRPSDVTDGDPVKRHFGGACQASPRVISADIPALPLRMSDWAARVTPKGLNVGVLRIVVSRCFFREADSERMATNPLPLPNTAASFGHSINRTMDSSSGLPSQGRLNVSVISIVIRIGWPSSRYGR